SCDFLRLYRCYSYFFFSSRRRHTRCLSDWSSDVCSSDLSYVGGQPRRRHTRRGHQLAPRRRQSHLPRRSIIRRPRVAVDASLPQIGRASCRERVKHTEQNLLINEKIRITNGG